MGGDGSKHGACILLLSRRLQKGGHHTRLYEGVPGSLPGRRFLPIPQNGKVAAAPGMLPACEEKVSRLRGQLRCQGYRATHQPPLPSGPQAQDRRKRLDGT